MKSFKLTNLRELSSEEQLKLNGGSMPEACDDVECVCECPCQCNSKNPDGSTSESSSKDGAKSVFQRKMTQAMQNM